MPFDFLKHPVARDTTPHPPAEILRRLVLAGLVAAWVIAAMLGLAGWAGGDASRLRAAAGCAALGLALLVAHRRLGPANAARPGSAAAGGAPSSTIAPPPAVSGAKPPRVLLIDASLAGPGGNCSRLLDALDARLAGRAETKRATLSGPEGLSFAALEPSLRAADAFVFATGTHWDSWSSSLQKFLEDATPAEATELWLGKPAAVLVTEHSVGGKAVLSRLQGVLVTLGCALPPFSGLVISHAAQLARLHAPDSAAAEDFWSIEDLDVVAHNLGAATRGRSAGWRAWPVDRKDYARVWLNSAGR